MPHSLCRWLILAMAALVTTAAPGAAIAQKAAPVPVAAPAPAADKGYVLGVNDAVAVTVFGQSEFSVTTRIKPDGTIVMPLIGAVPASGTTVLTLADVIKTKLVTKGFLKDPIVNVEIGAYASKTVNVAGKVTQPGVFPLDRPYRVLEMLLKAGWVQNSGANYVYLRRGADYQETRLSTEDLVRGTADKDPVLQPGDTIFVPDAETFYIYGQVARPGTYAILPDMTVRKALAIAGGVTALGSEKGVVVGRGTDKDIKATPDMLIQKGDILMIKERAF